MPEPDDITHWLGQLSAGDETAAARIWQGYFEKLVRLARRKLDDMPRRTADEEDVALSALNSFYRGVQAGRFPQLADREDLWKILVTITVRKVTAERRRQMAEKRGGGSVRGESIFVHRADADHEPGLEQVLGDEPTPELAAAMAETCSALLEKLDDELLRTVVLYKLEGYSNEEIAARLDVAVRTVERKLARVREKWEQADTAP